MPGQAELVCCFIQVSPDEVRALRDIMVCPDAARQTGVFVNGSKYFYLQSDMTQVQGKKGANGCSVAKAGTCKYGSMCMTACVYNVHVYDIVDVYDSICAYIVYNVHMYDIMCV